jgi:hypothetical protein
MPPPAVFLRPLAASGPTSSYATPVRYAVYPEQALIDDVPIRATLKQFAGHWEGDLAGSVRGRVVIDRRSGQVTPSSWIANDLKVPIDGGVLLYIDPRFQGDIPATPFGLERSYRGMALGTTPAAFNVLAVGIPEIPAGEQTRGPLGARLYREIGEDYASWARRANRREADRPDLPTLFALQVNNWSRPNNFAEAAYLASTRDLYLSASRGRPEDFDNAGRFISTAGLPDIDVSHWLMEGQAVLLLSTAEPGPAVLRRNGEPMPASQGNTLYRVRLPIGYAGTPQPLRDVGR